MLRRFASPADRESSTLPAYETFNRPRPFVVVTSAIADTVTDWEQSGYPTGPRSHRSPGHRIYRTDDQWVGWGVRFAGRFSVSGEVE